MVHFSVDVVAAAFTEVAVNADVEAVLFVEAGPAKATGVATDGPELDWLGVNEAACQDSLSELGKVLGECVEHLDHLLSDMLSSPCSPTWQAWALGGE